MPAPPACLPSAGLATDVQLLHLMSLRYGDAAGRVGFSDFVCCMLRLDTMTRECQHFQGTWQWGSLPGQPESRAGDKGHHTQRNNACLIA